LEKVGVLVDLATQYLLKLFVAGRSARTEQAIANLRGLCEGEFPGNYELVIIDVLLQPAIAEAMKILATPTLIKEGPLPVRRIIGDFSDKEKVLAGIGLLAR
jgi:circadian clock protein KaiB